MKYIKIYENFKKPDLREFGEFVYCKKSLHDEFSYEEEYDNGFQNPSITYINSLINFIEGKYYKVAGFFGKSNLDYVPLENISVVVLIDNSGKRYKLKVNDKYNINKYQHPEQYQYKNGFKDFYEFFDIPKFSDAIKKYNL